MPALRCLIRRWRALEPWIEGPGFQSRRYAFDTAALGDILTRRRSPIDKAFRPLSGLNVIAKVTFGGELFLRSDTEKRGYKGPLFEALPGDLIVSKIRVGQGSFCIVGEDLDHVAVSPEYPVYKPALERVDPGYLTLAMRTPEFLAQLTGSASGNTTKRRIRPAFFESRFVPLPPLDKQRVIVSPHRAAMERAADLECAAHQTEAQAMAEFEAALGFTPPMPLPDRPIFAASFKNLDRWSHEAILRRTVDGDAMPRSPYPIVPLGDVVANLENGWSPKCHDRPAEEDGWGVLKVSAASSGRYREIENKALPGRQKPKIDLEVRPEDVLITRASGVANLVGVAVIVERTRRKLMICDKIFRIVDTDNARVDNPFLACVLGIHSVRAQIEREFSTKSGMMKNVSKSVLLAVSFPLPPRDKQTEMVSALTDARTKAARLREQAGEVYAKSWADFEAAVYAQDDPSPPSVK